MLKKSIRDKLSKNLSTIRPARQESDWANQFQPLQVGANKHQRSGTIQMGPLDLIQTQGNLNARIDKHEDSINANSSALLGYNIGYHQLS